MKADVFLYFHLFKCNCSASQNGLFSGVTESSTADVWFLKKINHILLCSLSQYTFNDLSGSVSLAWVGDGTGVSVFHSWLPSSMQPLIPV